MKLEFTYAAPVERAPIVGAALGQNVIIDIGTGVVSGTFTEYEQAAGGERTPRPEQRLFAVALTDEDLTAILAIVSTRAEEQEVLVPSAPVISPTTGA